MIPIQPFCAAATGHPRPTRLESPKLEMQNPSLYRLIEYQNSEGCKRLIIGEPQCVSHTVHAHMSLTIAEIDL